jgi:DNA-binding response OmpR family regulator
MNRKILVVDDDKKIVELVSLYLRRDGYGVLAAYDGREALDLARLRQPDLVVLDLMLPELNGRDVGADDYVTKPFNPRELVARIRAVLRRVAPDEERPEDIRFGELLISFVRHEVVLRGKAVNLTPTEFRLLEALAREPGRAFSRAELLDRAFGYDYEGLERTVDVHIMNLRRKIEADPARPGYVVTVPGVGYRFDGRHGESGA